jgi:SAM-dependent methyltransferase
VGRDAKREVRELYRTRDFLDAYSAHTDMRVEDDPKQAVGGRWEEIGALQYEFVRSRGLLPEHKLLDIGCGTLRGGRHFIRYLNEGNYFGIDISPKAIEAAHRLVETEGLATKDPTLVLSRNKDLKFGEFEGERFDYLLAQSVFTHLKPEHIRECFEHIERVMAPGASFYFTFKKADRFEQRAIKGFSYPFGFFQRLAADTDLEIEDHSAEYPHPRGQRMVRASKPA